jgi:acetaldehyde dehydrogenase
MKVAILGTGNIGTDLLLKLRRRSGVLDVVLFAGIDPDSEGIARARALGVSTSTKGVDGVLADPGIGLVFEATSAAAHARHAPLLREAGKVAVDLTPAAVGPFVVPAVRCEVGEARNVNLVSCGGQAVIPMVHAVSRVLPLEYAETVTTIASRSAGPGTRANIDEFTVTTARGVESVGGAPAARSIIILNPAEPPILKQDTVYAVTRETPDEVGREGILASIHEMVSTVQSYVPGYRLKFDPVFDGRLVTLMLEVEGAGDFLPPYAGNLDIITSAAVAAGEAIAAAGSGGAS